MAEAHPDSPHPYHQLMSTAFAYQHHHHHQYSHGRHYAQPPPFPRPGPDARSYFPDVEMLRKVQIQACDPHYRGESEQRGRTFDRRRDSHQRATPPSVACQADFQSHSRHTSHGSSSHFSDDEDDEDEEEDAEECVFSSDEGSRGMTESNVHSGEDSPLYSVSLSSSSSSSNKLGLRHRREVSVIDGVLFGLQGGDFDSTNDQEQILTPPPIALSHRFSHLHSLANQRRTSNERDRNEIVKRALPPSELHARYLNERRRADHARPSIPIDFLPHPHRMARISLELTQASVNLRRPYAHLPMPRRHSSHDLDRENGA